MRGMRSDAVNRSLRCWLMTVALLISASIPSAFAETRTISWATVTTYSDGTAIEAGKTVSYSVYWTTDPGLGSLHTIGASLATTSTTFDPDVQGMTRGGTVYFTSKAVLNTGEESPLSPAYAWVVPVVTPPSVTPPLVTLSSITISGAASVNEGATSTYTATAAWSDGTRATVTPTWSTNLGTISAAGLFTSPSVTANQTVTVTATYGGRTGTMSVTIVDVPATAPAAAKNLGITGPISSGATQVWRLAWDPVTTYANGEPLPPGRSVRYIAYWTDDPALSAGSLRELSSLASDPALDFDPISRMMTKNRKTYLAVRAILDTGEESPISAALPWVSANTGPKAPTGGSIKQKNK